MTITGIAQEKGKPGQSFVDNLGNTGPHGERRDTVSICCQKHEAKVML